MKSALEYLQRLANSGLLSDSRMAALEADRALCALPPKRLAEALVVRKLISKYQSRVLLRSAKAKFDYGHYRVVGRHIDGFRCGMFQAIDRTNGRRVELDRVDVRWTDTPPQSIRHPNLIGCIDALVEDGQSIFAFEVADGEPLDERMDRVRLPLLDAIKVAHQVALACWALHSSGLFHGMICPAAVLMNGSTANLIWRPGRTLPGNGAIAARLQKLAAANMPNDPKSMIDADVYALGKLLHCMTKGNIHRPDSIVRWIDGATRTGEGRFPHAGVFAMLTETTQDIAFAEQQIAIVEKSPAVRILSRHQARRHKWLVGAVVAVASTLFVGWFVARSIKVESRSGHEFTASGPDTESHDAVKSTQSDSNDLEPMPQSLAALELQEEPASGRDALFGMGNDRPLWMSPTSGASLEFLPLPPNAPFYVHIRPAATMSMDQARKAVDALGPSFQQWRKSWEESTGLAWEELDSLTAAVVPQDGRAPEVCWLAQLCDGVDEPSSWAQGQSVEIHGQSLTRLGEIVVWNSSQGVVIGSETVVRKTIENRNASTLLRRELEELRRNTDQQRLFSTLFVPRFLSTEGRKLTTLQTHALRTGLLNLIGGDTRACSISMHMNEVQFFGELRVASDADRGAVRRAQEIREEIRQIPQAMESAVAGLPVLDDYWRRLALRSGPMMRFLVDNIRVAPARRDVVVNVSLPSHAAHNLFMAIELVTAARQAKNAESLENGVTSEGTIRVKMSVSDVLQQRLSVEIPQQSIEFALRDVAEELNSRLDESSRIEIRIDGPALQADGITRNQQIRGFYRDNATIVEILTGLVSAANPVRTVTTPTDSEQKLVWLSLAQGASGEHLESEGRIILITTRTAATEKGYSLPSVFEGK